MLVSDSSPRNSNLLTSSSGRWVGYSCYKNATADETFRMPISIQSQMRTQEILMLSSGQDKITTIAV